MLDKCLQDFAAIAEAQTELIPKYAELWARYGMGSKVLFDFDMKSSKDQAAVLARWKAGRAEWKQVQLEFELLQQRLQFTSARLRALASSGDPALVDAEEGDLP